MNREEVIRMAKEAGVTPVNRAHLGMEPIWWSVTIEDIERFAALRDAAMKERCAKACESVCLNEHGKYREDSESHECAIAIRALP